MADLTYYPKKVSRVVFHFLLSSTAYIYSLGRRKSIPRIENPLLFKSANKLAEEIREGKLKSEEVVEAYIDRIKQVEPYINAVVDDCFCDALKEAKEADELIESGKLTKQQLVEEMPLLGVPFTVKNLLSVKGLSYTSGCLMFKDRVATEDAPTVALMKKAGAIVLATTNSAEFGLHIETNNFVHGKTSNPYDITRTPGGSSGGECALQSSAGSVVGLGNDLLGSIRVPAHYCGLFSHKATIGQISNGGVIPSPPSSMAHILFTGPICRYSEDLVLMMKVLTSENKETFSPREQVDFKNLKIYYQTAIENPLVRVPDNEIIEAVENAVSHFTKNYGATAKEVKIQLLNKMDAIGFHLCLGKVPNIMKTITNGSVTYYNGYLEMLKWLFGKSIFTFSTILFTLGPKLKFYNENDIPFYETQNEILSNEFDELLDENSIFIIPTFPVTAPHHYGSLMLITNFCYTGAFNCNGMPVTQCPMGLCKNGMPRGIQIVGRKNNDALTLACAAELEKAFGGWIPPE